VPSTLSVPVGVSYVSFLIYANNPKTITTNINFLPSPPIYDYVNSVTLSLVYRDSILIGGATIGDLLTNLRTFPGDTFPIPLVFGRYQSNNILNKEVPNNGKFKVSPYALSKYVLMDYPSISATEFGKDSEVGIHGYGRYGFIHHVDSSDNSYSIPSVSYTSGIIGNLPIASITSDFSNTLYLELQQTKYVSIRFPNVGTYDIGTYNLTFYMGGGSSVVSVTPSVVNVTNGLFNFPLQITGTVAGTPAILRIATSKPDILEIAFRFAVGPSVTVFQVNPGSSLGAGGLIRVVGPNDQTVIFQPVGGYNVTSESGPSTNLWGNAITMCPFSQYSFYLQGAGPNVTYTLATTDKSPSSQSLTTYSSFLYCCQAISASGVKVVSTFLIIASLLLFMLF